MAEQERRGSLQRDLERELHDMCQPLTLLQGRLELGKMCGDQASLLKAVDGALEETERMFDRISAMRVLLANFGVGEV